MAPSCDDDKCASKIFGASSAVAAGRRSVITISATILVGCDNDKFVFLKL